MTMEQDSSTALIKNISEHSKSEDNDETKNLPYGSTKRSAEYTTENYKLEIGNLPDRIKYHVVRNLLENQLKIAPKKIRVGTGKAYIALKSEEERDAALIKINNCEWKDRHLVARPATARYDPFVKKLKAEEDAGTEEPMDDSAESINLQVCPLWEKSYDDQIKIKTTLMKAVLNLGKSLTKMYKKLDIECPRLYEWVKSNKSVCCPFEGVVPSPVLNGYRNKCEFNVNRDGTVGFRLGRYKDGSEKVVSPPADCPIVSEIMFKVISILQEHLKNPGQSKLKGYNSVTHEGNVRQLTVRTNSKSETLLIVDIHPQDLSKEDIDSEIIAIVDKFKQEQLISSIYFNVSAKSHLADAKDTLRLAYGADHLIESLEVQPDNPLKFRIGPTSFFQVNTKAAELLYRSIIEVAGLGPNSQVLDVGCGTGTIGLSLAKKVCYVIGIEIVKSAVEDAKINAKENGISNVLFLEGRAEDLLNESIAILRNKQNVLDRECEIVAIVDPPRVGFNNSFIKHLRASNIKKIVYVACDPKANTNLVSLCRPRSKAYQGDPFVPTRAKAFDMFPHTKFCELVLVYERLTDPEKTE